MGGGVKSTSKYTVKVEDLLAITRKSFNEFLKTDSGDVTSWLDLLRTCRQPQILWDVDYIEPKEGMDDINEYIRQTEKILYEGNSVTLRPQFSAHLDQQSAFCTIRAHLKAETSPEAAKEIFSDMLDTFYSDLSVIRKSNLLYHSCLAFLCCGDFSESYECFERHWALLKYASPSDRIKEGIMDNHVILQMAYWFFVKHVDDFRDFYSVKSKADMESIWNHKKISLLYFMEYDCAWMTSCCGLSFYQHARASYPLLPKYERKRSTPSNEYRRWHPDDVAVYAPEISSVGQEKYYFEQYNREVDMTRKFPNPDKADDYLYSYYHYQNDYVKDTNHKAQLVDYIQEFVDVWGDDTEISSVVELGCGVEMPSGLSSKEYLGVDISEKVCSVLMDQNNLNCECVHSPADKFMISTDKSFDLCFAYDLLNHMKPHRLKLLLKACAEKCKYLAAKIDTRDDFRSDILSKKLRIDRINLHCTVRTHEEWVEILEDYFEVEHSSDGPWLYVFCRAR